MDFRCFTTALALGVLFVGSGSPEAKAQANTESQAEANATEAERNRLATDLFLQSFATGNIPSATPEDDLSEPSQSLRRIQSTYGYVVVSDSNVEILVDRNGQIYRDRVYQGIIPGLRNELYEGQLDSLANRDLVLWVGFQSMAALQRLFFLISDPNPNFEVTRLSDKKIEVVFPNFDVPNRNTTRGLWTEHFNGPVHRVLGRKDKRGVRYTIELKTDARLLYRWEPPFLFVDFERSIP